MSVLSNNIYQILARRSEKFTYNGVNISLNIHSIEKENISDQEVMAVKCSFVVRYMDGKDINAEVAIFEKVILSLPKRKLNAILKEWEKNNKVDESYKKDVIIPIEVLCSYDAHIVTNKMRLPPPVKYPFLDQ